MRHGFVLGFVFDQSLKRVLLIKKNRGPEGTNMAGKLNGVGGHIEHFDLCPKLAMKRECYEECDLSIDDWVEFCKFVIGEEKIYCFYAIIDDFKTSKYKQITDEEISDYWINSENNCQCSHGDYRLIPHMPNLEWLIPMALNHYKGLDTAKAFEVREIND